jgi:small-conductance mechanosensitive channel
VSLHSLFNWDTLTNPIVDGLVSLIVCWLAAAALSRIARRALRLRNVDPETLILVPRAIYFGLLVLGIAIFFSVLFRQPSFALNGVLIATLIAGLGFQDLVKNYVSGFYIVFEGKIRVGDTIQVDAYTGTVTDIRLRVTFLQGEDDSLIVVPNSELFNKTVVIRRPGPRPAKRARRVLPGRAPRSQAR